MEDPGQFTQSIQPHENVMHALKTNDVLLLDDEGRPFAVLMEIGRYRRLDDDG